MATGRLIFLTIMYWWEILENKLTVRSVTCNTIDMKQQGIASIIIILAFVAAGIVGAVVWFRQTNSNPSNPIISQPTPTDTPRAAGPTATPTPPVASGKQATWKGKVVCLPFKDTGGIRPMSCAMGLQADNGTYWVLNNIQDALIQGKFAGGDTIEVKGTSAPYEGPLQVSGIINVTAVNVLQKTLPNNAQ